MIDYILDSIFSIFGKDNVVLIIYYGNKKGKDIDVFVVISGNTKYNCKHSDRLDITYVGNYWINEMINHLDPRLTDPISTGDVIYGDSKQIYQRLRKTKPSEKTTKYLKDKAVLFFQWSKIHLQNGDLRQACDCIRFSISFYYFAEHYKINDWLIDFLALTNQYRKELDLMKKAEKMAKQEENLVADDVVHIINETFLLLTQ